MALYPADKDDYNEVKAILDNLVWNGEHIPYYYDYSGYFRIPFNKVKSIISIIPNYESYHLSLNGCIQINLGYDFRLSLECPCVCKDDAVSKYRNIRWYEHLNKLPVTPCGIADKNWVMDVCPFKTESKLFKTTKVACWSDSLDIDKALAIAKHFNGRIRIAFGIGTYLGATVCGTKREPLSMVMKVVEVNGKPVVKLSESATKCMCHDENHINYVKMKYNYKSIDEMTVEEILEMLPAFKDVKLSDIYHPAKAA